GKKVCAGGITPYKYRHIKGMNIPKKLIEREFWEFEIGHKNKTAAIRATSSPLVASVSRTKLGQWMAQKARNAGAIINQGSFMIWWVKNMFRINIFKRFKKK
ncbi:NAD(P)/FAD-dependent oxidoreductase, partial [candidate division KSB1 bacterium]